MAEPTKRAAEPNQLPLAFTDPDPRRLARRGDSGGSLAAAVGLVESGRDQVQVAFAIALVVSLPGRTSAELARETAKLGAQQGFDPREWRYVLGRRLSEAEDEGRGPIVGHEYRFHPLKPWRAVSPEQPPCKVANRRAIRWWPSSGPTPKERPH